MDFVHESLDLIKLEVYMGDRRNKRITSYLNTQNLFSLLIFSFQRLKRGGVLDIPIGELGNQVIIDIIALLKHVFNHVYIVKSALQNIIMPYKNILCKGFLGIDDNMLQAMNKISKKWDDVNKGCNVELYPIPDHYVYIDNLFNYKGNNKALEYFDTLEILKKMIIWTEMINTYSSIVLEKDNVINLIYERNITNKLYYIEKHGINIHLNFKPFFSGISRE